MIIYHIKGKFIVVKPDFIRYMFEGRTKGKQDGSHKVARPKKAHSNQPARRGPVRFFRYSVHDFGAMGATVERNLPDWVSVKLGDEEPGDCLLMRLKGIPVHIGVVVERGVMLHTHSGMNSVIERYDALRWERRITGVYRYVGKRLRAN